MRAAREDNVSRVALVPLLDALRQEGICVLARGAIEDYYPADVPGSGAKPERALAAAARVTSAAGAAGLSQPLEAGRRSELEQVFEELFRNF